MRERADYPNIYQGDEYPLNFIFNGNDSPQEGDVVGDCHVKSMAGDELKATIHYLLIWSGDTVLSMTPERYELWRDK